MDLSDKIGKLTKEQKTEYFKNRSDILNSREDALRYGITDYNKLPNDQVRRAEEKLYSEMFEK
jgi:hypothetical protein